MFVIDRHVLKTRAVKQMPPTRYYASEEINFISHRDEVFFQIPLLWYNTYQTMKLDYRLVKDLQVR